MTAYRLDATSSDTVVELADMPQMSPGAPMPQVLADEGWIVLAYQCFEREPWAHSMTPAEADTWWTRPGDLFVLVTFSYRAFCFGPPNDETLARHPLHSRGLRPYGAYEVRPSTWIRHLDQMSAVHPNHNPAHFDGSRHFIFTFHDSTFECVARRVDLAPVRSPPAVVAEEMRRLLDVARQRPEER